MALKFWRFCGGVGMQIIKKIRLPYKKATGHTATAMCVVRSNCYGSRMQYIKKLISAAKETWPQLDEDIVRIVQFAGDRYARTYGIEFQCPDQEVSVPPNGWREIAELEFTF